MWVSALGRTETIKKRAIYVYLPSIEQKERWEDYARKHGASISKFVIEHVENSLSQEEDTSYRSRGDLWKDVQALQERVRDLERDKRLLEHVVDRLEAELRKYRAQPFLDENFTGVRRYDKGLVELLKSGEALSSEEILSRLGIEPSEYEAVKAVSKQLDLLMTYGLVRVTPRGWRWVK